MLMRHATCIDGGAVKSLTVSLPFLLLLLLLPLLWLQ
jgi:hypothetical protein